MAEIQFAINPESLAAVRRMRIEANFDECSARLSEMMQPYAEMVVTEGDIAAAKADRARIRKVEARIDEARKIAKEAYSAPLKAFEEQCRALTAICTNASGNLDRQVKGFEQAQREERIASIRRYFEEHVAEAAQYLTWQDVCNERWGNSTYGMDKAMREVQNAIDACLDDLTTIRRMQSPFEATLLDLYRSSHNLSACIRKNQELQLIQEREARRRAAENEADRQKGPSQWLEIMREDAIRGSLKYENPEHERILAQQTPPAVTQKEQADESLIELDFRCWVTERQMQALRQFLKDNGIRFGRVPKECGCCGD